MEQPEVGLQLDPAIREELHQITKLKTEAKTTAKIHEVHLFTDCERSVYRRAASAIISYDMTSQSLSVSLITARRRRQSSM